MIQQAKFTYSLLGKAFEKQIKAIENQGEKQMKAIRNQRQVTSIKKYAYVDEDSSLISKQKEIFNRLADKRLDDKLDEQVDCDDLIYRYKGKTPDEKFNTFDNALDLIDKIKNGELKLAEAKKYQIRFKSNLGEIRKENIKLRSKE